MLMGILCPFKCEHARRHTLPPAAMHIDRERCKNMTSVCGNISKEVCYSTVLCTGFSFAASRLIAAVVELNLPALS